VKSIRRIGRVDGQLYADALNGSLRRDCDVSET
jgi:hypothetical protein